MKHKALIAAVIFYLAGQAADVASSLLSTPPGIEESNEFARNTAHHAVLSHMIVLKVLLTICIVVIVSIGHATIKTFSEPVAEMIAIAPFLWYALDGWNAVVNNVFIHFGWYNP